MIDDLDLLHDYAQRRSEPAFAELVRRHTDLVYSTALRLVTEHQAAQDVTQMVFVRLARQAGSLREGTLVTGWLYRTTQFVAQTVLRSEGRRRQRESLAMQESELRRDGDSVWKELAPLLDEAMAQLARADQDAVLLRYFSGRSLREVGEALGISDDTAQKRVDRALDRMRTCFARSGVRVPAAVLGSILATHTVQAAPAPLASTLAAKVISRAASHLGVVTGFQVFQATLAAQLKAHGVGLGVAALLLLGGAVALLPTPAGQVAPPADVMVLRGRVQTPDGKPLAGALIRAGTPQLSVRLYASTNAPTNTVGALQRQPPSATSAADGSFAIGLSEWPKDDLAAVVATADAGYGLATADELRANPVVIVRPWARLEGVLRVGKSPASNQTVNIGIWGSTELYHWNLVQHGTSTQTDGNGRFVFPRLAPVDVWLTRTVLVKTNDGRQSGHLYVPVRPGEQLEVELGGTGCALTGRLLLSPTNRLSFYGSMWANAARGIRHPRNWKEMSREEQRRYEGAWRATPEAQAWKDSVRNYEFPVRRDGTFRVDDVLPGTYRMQVRADEPVPGGRGMRHAARVEITVEVPDLNGDEPIDVGVLVPKAVIGDR